MQEEIEDGGEAAQDVVESKPGQSSHASSGSTRNSVDFREEVRGAFTLHSSANCISIEALPNALKSLGFAFDEGECRRILSAVHLADSDKLSAYEFGLAVVLATLRDNDFPTQNLITLCGTPAGRDATLEHVDQWTLSRVNALLKSNFVNLGVREIKQWSLFSLLEAVADKLEIRRKSAWLNESGIVTAVANLLPHFAGRPITPEAMPIPRERMLAQLSEDLRDVNQLLLRHLDSTQLSAQEPGECDAEEALSCLATQPVVAPGSNPNHGVLSENSPLPSAHMTPLSGGIPLSTVVKRRGHRFNSWEMIGPSDASGHSSFSRRSRKASEGSNPGGGSSQRREFKWWEPFSGPHEDLSLQEDDEEERRTFCQRLYQVCERPPSRSATGTTLDSTHRQQSDPECTPAIATSTRRLLIDF
jgi:hypothetical protein